MPITLYLTLAALLVVGQKAVALSPSKLQGTALVEDLL